MKILATVHNQYVAEVRHRIESAVFSNPRIRTLAANPLILTILVLLNESRGGALPRRRVDLYAKIVDVFLDTWESSKRQNTFDENADIDLDCASFGGSCRTYRWPCKRPTVRLPPRWWLADRMRDCLQEKLGFDPDEARDASERIIVYLAGRTGLIQEYGLDVFAFSHRTLQEYFASLGAIDEANASASRSIIDFLRSYFFHPQWSEVVRLIAASRLRRSQSRC